MSSEAIRPSTLDGIKRLAKSIKVERGIQHARALDEAAQAGGFQNFRHANNILNSSAPRQLPPSGHRVFITSYWRDRTSGKTGRETLAIWLSSPWGSLIEPHQLQNHRALLGFRVEGPDHLAYQNSLSTQSLARRAACAAARTLNFMDATKLRPSRSHSRAYPQGDSRKSIPGRDHYSIWYDRSTKRFLFADEPYERAAASKAQERESWAKQYGFSIEKPAWPGMYAPDIGSRLYLISDEIKGIPLQPIVAALEKLPPPIVEATWNGESASMLPIFVSPGAIAEREAAKDQPKMPRKPKHERNSVSYVRTFIGPQRRPKGRMPIATHAKVGGLLKSVLVATRLRKGVCNRLNSIRCELDDWVQCEYTREELPNEQFFDLYYREESSTFSRSLPEAERNRHAESLAQAKKLLSDHYSNCPPLRSLLKKIDASVKSLQSWTS